MERERAHARKMTSEEAEQLEDWKALQLDAQNVLRQLQGDLQSLEDEGGDTDALYSQIEEAEAAVKGIQEVISLLHASLAEWTKKQLATCGVILSIGHSGSLEVRAGWMKASDRKAIDKAQIEKLKEAGKPIPASLQAAASKGERAAYSERLMLDMTAHRTAAMQAALTDNAHVALALTVHSMVMPILGADRYASTPLKLSIHETKNTQLAGRASEYDTSSAAETMASAEDKWGNRVPGGDNVTVYRWLLKQDTNTLLDLLAFCAASSLDAMHGRERESFDMSDALAESLDLDMADWWAPTAGKYLGSVSKVQLVEAVTEVENAEAAKPMMTMKKGDAVAYAAAKLDGKRWLPLPLKRKPSQGGAAETIEE
jgi:ParB family transcriptional regulator, chromosome partitioning protein